MTATELRLDADRLLPPDPGVRALARRLYEHVADLPILSPHGHVDARVLLDDAAFADPATLLISPDHYVFRLLHAAGAPLSELGVGQAALTESAARTAWGWLCRRWNVFAGTPVRQWLEAELVEIFGVSSRPSAASADALYDQVADCLSRPEFRPRALFERFGIEVLATTDDPADDLAAHAALRDDPGFTARVIPTFRPDRYLDPSAAGWSRAVAALGHAAGAEVGDYRGYLAALEDRRRHFIAQGAVSADHGCIDAQSEPLGAAEAERIFAAALLGQATAAEATAFRRSMLSEMARMSCDDGLVMTVHPGVLRNHHEPTFARFGPDAGNDIGVGLEFTRALRPLLNRYGTHPNLHLVLFTVDETLFSREIAPLAGFYPSVYAGAPWWFLDAPEAIRRYRAAVTETAGFTRTSGFIDDTRAFCSIPARHDMSRRIDAGYLAGLAAEHRIAEDEAFEIAHTLTADNPRHVFKL
ncbi:MAG: Glucuronate isomerase [Frankiales bacterium]|nr:Glucuronate isomerase [Frankiales bacterium]